MNNGDGLRVVLWLSGCSHHCFNCQNPQTWDPDSGILFDESAKQEIFNELSKDYISGITLSGGDPLHENNLSDVLSLVKEIRHSFPQKTIWLYTGFRIRVVNMSNYPSWDNYFETEDVDMKGVYHSIRSEILNSTDVIVDGEYIDEQRDVTLRWRGSTNQRVIDTKKSLEQGNVVLYCD